MATWYKNSQSHGADSNNAEELLTCSICTEPYDDDTHQAKFLTCHHTFCSHCLTDLSKKQDSTAAISCPNCRQPTQLPTNGAAGLQRNFYIEHMKRISKKNEQQIKNSCQEHGYPQSFFCETCITATCPECSLRYHDQSAGHVIKDIAEANVLHRQVLLLHMNKKQISLEEIQDSLKDLEMEMALLPVSKETAKEQIKESIQLAHKKLEEQQDILIESTEEQFIAIQNILLSKRKTLQEGFDILSRNLNEAVKMIKTGTLNEVIAINQNLMNTTEMHSDLAELDLGNNFKSLDSNKGTGALKRSTCDPGEINIQSLLPAKVEFRTKGSAAASTSNQSVMHVEIFIHNGDAVPVMDSLRQESQTLMTQESTMLWVQLDRSQGWF